MRLKRIARALLPVTLSIIIAGLISLFSGVDFPFGVVIIGAILSYLAYQYWDSAYTAGGKFYKAVQQGWVWITEEKVPSSTPDPKPRPDAPTEPITGHFRPLEPDPTPAPAPSEPDPQPTEDKDKLITEQEEPAFVIGRTEDGRTIELDEISSLGVGGVPGSGKTVSVVGLCTQAVVKYKGNVRFLVVDPHMHTGSKDALSARMAPLSPFYLNVPSLPNPVSGGGELLSWMKWMTDEARARLGGKVSGDRLVLVADEFTALLDDPQISEPLTELLLLINEQARKVHMFALVASPSWKSSRVQGTDIRNTIATFLIHNMPPAIARMLIPYAEAERSNTLAKGQAIFSSFGQVEIVRVPLMNSSDIARCVKPYLPATEPETIVVSSTPAPKPSIAEVRSIWETYMILNRELHYEEDSAIRALAIDVYGPGDPHGIDKVKRALKLGEEYL